MTFTAIDMEVRIKETKKDIELTKTITAKLDGQYSLSFRAVTEFINNFNKINIALKKAIKNNSFVHIYISNATYENIDGEFITKKFDLWQFHDYLIDEYKDGFYISTHKKYTDANRAIWYQFNLESITD